MRAWRPHAVDGWLSAPVRGAPGSIAPWRPAIRQDFCGIWVPLVAHQRQARSGRHVSEAVACGDRSGRRSQQRSINLDPLKFLSGGPCDRGNLCRCLPEPGSILGRLGAGSRIGVRWTSARHGDEHAVGADDRAALRWLTLSCLRQLAERFRLADQARRSKVGLDQPFSVAHSRIMFK
jgi:hypothetical protein